MEPISLGIGILSLIGLFRSCIEAAEGVTTFRAYETDSHDLEAQFAADRLRLTRWGRRVGLHQQQLSSSHHTALDDADTFRAISDLLITIERVLRDSIDTPQSSSGTNGPGTVIRRRQTDSLKTRLSWTLWSKKERMQQVGLFGASVRKLYEVVPLEAQEYIASLQG